ncbi:hypothetical protein KQI84_03270 [bacterium]|nr:hypothetical protein [bacterium]
MKPEEYNELRQGLAHWPWTYRVGFNYVAIVLGNLISLKNPLLMDRSLSKALFNQKTYRILSTFGFLCVLLPLAFMAVGLSPKGILSLLTIGFSGGIIAVFINSILVQRCLGKILHERASLFAPANLSASSISPRQYLEAQVTVPTALTGFVANAVWIALMLIPMVNWIIKYLLRLPPTVRTIPNFPLIVYAFGMFVAFISGSVALMSSALAFRAHALTNAPELAHRRAVRDFLRLAWPLVLIALVTIPFSIAVPHPAILFALTIALLGLLLRTLSKFRPEMEYMIGEIENLAPLWWGEGADVNLDELTQHRWNEDWVYALREEVERIQEDVV